MLPKPNREVLDHCNGMNKNGQGQHRRGLGKVSSNHFTPTWFLLRAAHRLWGWWICRRFQILLFVFLWAFGAEFHILLPLSHTMSEDLLRIVLICPCLVIKDILIGTPEVLARHERTLKQGKGENDGNQPRCIHTNGNSEGRNCEGNIYMIRFPSR